MKLTTGDLKKIRFFEHYTDKQLVTIAKMSSLKEFKVKDILFEQYDELSEVFVLLEGSLVAWDKSGKRKKDTSGFYRRGPAVLVVSCIFSIYFNSMGNGHGSGKSYCNRCKKA